MDEAKIFKLTLILCLLASFPNNSAYSQGGNIENHNYYVIKRTFYSLPVYEPNIVPKSYYNTIKPAIDLRNCVVSSAFGVDEGEKQFFYDLAWGIAYIKKRLIYAKIPSSIWKEKLISIENKILDQIRSEQIDSSWTVNQRLTSFSEELSKNINSVANQDYPEFVVVGGCGDGEMAVKMSTHPSNGQIYLIPLFFWYLCEETGKSKNDVEKCDRWRAVPNGAQHTEVAGDYRYIVAWPSGEKRSGLLEFRHHSEANGVLFTPNGISSLN